METGFPSPAQGYESKPIDLNSMLIRNKPATYLMEMSGHALESVGIFPKDWLIVDRSKKPSPESIVIAYVAGEYLCRILSKTTEGYKLLGDNCSPIKVDEDVQIIGAVPYSIRRFP
jgi:DNA polymerase V